MGKNNNARGFFCIMVALYSVILTINNVYYCVSSSELYKLGLNVCSVSAFVFLLGNVLFIYGLAEIVNQ